VERFLIPRITQKQSIQSLPLKTLSGKITPTVLILLAVTLLVLHRANIFPVEKTRVMVMDAVTPILSVVSSPVNSMINSFDGVKSFRELKAENIRLQEENTKLQKWYESALKLQAENQSFRELLNVKADPSVTFVTARVVSDVGGTFVKSVLLPVGSIDKVQKGNAVMSGRGLVGRVTEVGAQSSRVLLVTDLNSRIPVIIQNTRTRAILAGKNQDLLKLERLPPDSGLVVGTRIVTSGDGGQLMAEIPIGTIVAIDAGGAWVKPLSDIEKLTHVEVVNTAQDESLITGDIASVPRPVARTHE
jgi:rod shape-determining protein MreC